MTVEELLGLPDIVSRLTDKQLDEHLAQHFPFTRPPAPPSSEQLVGARMMTLAGGSSLADKLKAAQAAQDLAKKERMAALNKHRK